MNLFSKFFRPTKHSAKEVNLKISSSLEDFVKNEVLPGLNISPHYFWSSFENLVETFSNRNKDLLIKRSEIKKKLMIGTFKTEIINSI